MNEIKNLKRGKEIRIYVDMDHVLCDYQKSHMEIKRMNPEIMYPQSQYGFFANLEPIDNAIMVYLFLNKYFDVYILTAPSVMNPMSYTEKRDWVGKYLGIDIAHKLILSPDKSVFIGDYLIDDTVAGRAKQDQFKGTQIVFGSDEYPDWLSVLEYFKKYLKP